MRVCFNMVICLYVYVRVAGCWWRICDVISLVDRGYLPIILRSTYRVGREETCLYLSLTHTLSLFLCLSFSICLFLSLNLSLLIYFMIKDQGRELNLELMGFNELSLSLMNHWLLAVLRTYQYSLQKIRKKILKKGLVDITVLPI